MTINEYLTFRLGIWEKVQTETANIIATELLLVMHKFSAEKVEKSIRNIK